jgi:trimeric autotransporter adhesin
VLGLDAGVVRVRALFGGATAEALVTFEPDAGTLELWPPAPTVAKDTALPVAVTLRSASGDSSDVTQDVVWTSTDPTVGIVTNAPGSPPQLLGRDAGQVDLLGRLDALELRTTAQVTGAGLASLELQGPPTLVRWAPTAFRAIGHFTDGSLQDLTRWLSWSSSRPNRLRVLGTGPQRGAALALLAGTVEVAARPRGGPMTPPLSVQIDGTELSSLTIVTPPVVARTQAQLHATGHGADGATADVTGVVEWSSSDPTLAIVSSLVRPGWLRALAPGTVVLQARLGAITGSTSLTIGGATLTSLSISAPATVTAGQAATASAVAALSGGGTQTISEDVVWSSDSPQILAVSNARGTRGALFGLAPGSATLSARARVQGSPGVVATARVTVQGAK